jgi:putative transposase
MVGDIKHVFNRGIRKGIVFFDDADYLRFIGNLYRLNNKSGALRVKESQVFTDPPKSEKLVEILKWGLIPNHYHLQLYELVDGGITEFMKRIGNGFTKYINIKRKQSGYVFQNSAKMVSLVNDRHFLYVPIYIDLNPLDLLSPNWRSGECDADKAINLLLNYKWSSFSDFFGKPRFPNFVNKKLFYELYNTNEKSYLKDLKEFIKSPFKKDEHFYEWDIDRFEDSGPNVDLPG